MSGVFPVVQLGQVIEHRKEFIQISDVESYKRCRVQLHAKGIVLRDIVSGSQIKTKKQQVCRAGDFLVAEIDAKVGGFGIVPDDLDGAIVSSHYFLFEVNDAVLDRRFLDYFVRTPGFRDQVSAQGSTNYAAIRPRDVLGYEIPLPPLDEQRRIVARIDELAVKIEEARRLKTILMQESESLRHAVMRQAFSSVCADRVASVSEVSTVVTKGTTPKTYGHAFVQSGVPFLRVEDVQDGFIDWKNAKYFLSDETNQFMSRSQTKSGDVLITIAGTIGRSAVVPADAPMLNMNQAVALVRPSAELSSSYLHHFVQSPQGQEQLRKATVTTAISNISLTTIRNVQIPIPSLESQQRVVQEVESLRGQIDGMTRLQRQVTVELDAMLPAVLDQSFRGEL